MGVRSESQGGTALQRQAAGDQETHRCCNIFGHFVLKRLQNVKTKDMAGFQVDICSCFVKMCKSILLVQVGLFLALVFRTAVLSGF